MDINKKGSREGEKKVPESLGLASGVVFLVRLDCCCLPALLMLLSAAALAMLRGTGAGWGGNWCYHARPVLTVPWL